MEKIKLTKEMLEKAKPNSVIYTGYVTDNQFGFNINGTNKLLKFVVCRGQIPDWCIYVEDCYRDMTFEQVKNIGHKIYSSTAKVVIDADEEVWKWYRN